METVLFPILRCVSLYKSRERHSHLSTIRTSAKKSNFRALNYGTLFVFLQRTSSVPNTMLKLDSVCIQIVNLSYELGFCLEVRRFITINTTLLFEFYFHHRLEELFITISTFKQSIKKKEKRKPRKHFVCRIFFTSKTLTQLAYHHGY